MRKRFDFSRPRTEEMKMMRSQLALATAGRGAALDRTSRASTVLGAMLLFAALSPMLAVSGFMLAQIFGYSYV